jgi:DNA polymerase V
MIINSTHDLIFPLTESSSNPLFRLPLYLAKVPAGFPSPAEDYLSTQLDLNEHLIKHPAATFLVRASGSSMVDAGIHENDILVVDKSCPPISGKIVIAAIDGQLTVKRLHKKPDGKFILKAEHPNHPPIEVNENSDVHIWGVVTYIIHAV